MFSKRNVIETKQYGRFFYHPAQQYGSILLWTRGLRGLLRRRGIGRHELNGGEKQSKKERSFQRLWSFDLYFFGERKDVYYLRIDLRIPPSLVFRITAQRERENKSGFSNFVERAATDAATLSQKRGGRGGMVLRRRREPGHTCP